MKFQLRKSQELSGSKTGVYVVHLNDDNESQFEKFLNENISSFKNELMDILERLKTITNKTGAREQFFKTKEGKPGDHLEALFDKPNSHLRLYCLRFGQQLLILGGGGEKPKNIKTWQESEKLTEENLILQKLSNEIYKRLTEKTLRYSEDFTEFQGELTFKEDTK